jgi:hypothetical protein
MNRYRFALVTLAIAAALVCVPSVAAGLDYWVYGQMGTSSWRGVSGDIYDYGAAGHSVPSIHVSSLYAWTSGSYYVETGIVEDHVSTGED